MSLVYYTKIINGRLYPKKAREGGRFAFVNEVKREGERVKTKYLGIKEVPKGAEVEARREDETPTVEKLEQVDTPEEEQAVSDVVEMSIEASIGDEED